MDATVGQSLQIMGIGPVKVEKVYKSGSGVVRDTNGALWLIPADQFLRAEINLFSFVPDLPETKQPLFNGKDF